MSVAVTVTNIYAVNVCEAKEDASCWRQYMRLYAMMCAVAFAAGIALLVCFLDQVGAATPMGARRRLCVGVRPLTLPLPLLLSLGAQGHSAGPGGAAG